MHVSPDQNQLEATEVWLTKDPIYTAGVFGDRSIMFSMSNRNLYVRVK